MVRWEIETMLFLSNLQAFRLSARGIAKIAVIDTCLSRADDAVSIAPRQEIVSWLSTVTPYVTAPSTVILRFGRSTDGVEILGSLSLSLSLARVPFAIISGGSPDIFAC